MKCKKFIYSLILIILSALSCAQNAMAQGIEYTDSCHNMIQAYRNQSVLNYGPDQIFTPYVDDNPIKKIEEEPTDLSLLSNSIHIILYCIIGVIVLVILWVVFRNVDFRKLWNSIRNLFKTKAKKQHSNVLEQDILITHFDENLQDAINASNYKDAIRLIYIKTLTLLNEHKYIKLNKAKNATEYYYEIQYNQKIKKIFKNLIKIYLIASYDDTIVKQEDFDNAYTEFKLIKNGF